MTEFLTASAELALWAVSILALAGVIWPRRRWTLFVAATLLWIDVVWLATRLAVVDLSLVYVVDYARAGVSIPFRIAGLWGGPAGSLLLFTAGTATVVAFVRTPRVYPVRVLSATVAVLTATVAIAGPFRRLAIPAISGGGMQPILEHWAMLIHPPVLYLGLVLAAGVWAHAVGGSSLPRIRLWLVATFAVLTLGQLLGSNWAYVELGWGGYWAWDPVENGIAVVWLLLIAGLHSTGRHDRVQRVAAASGWVGVLFAAFITRSGGGGSVHAFADDRATGAILSLATIATIAATAAGTMRPLARAGRSQAGRSDRALLDRASIRHPQWRFGAFVLSLAAAIVVTVGLLYPVLLPGDQVVNGTYFAALTAPIAVVAVAGVGTAFLLWVGRRTMLGALTGGVVGGLLGTVLGARTAFAVAVSIAAGVGFAAFAIGLIQRRRRGTPVRWSVVVAHLGVLIMVIGMAGSTQAVRSTHSAQPGDRFEVDGIVFEHVGVEAETGVDINRLSATVIATVGSRSIEMSPSVQEFRGRGVFLAETDLFSRPSRDILVVVGGATDLGLARYEVSVTPLLQLIWWGAGLIALGAAMSAARLVRRRDPDEAALL